MLKIINNAKSIFFFSFKNKKVQSQQQHKLPQWLQVIKKKWIQCKYPGHSQYRKPCCFKH